MLHDEVATERANLVNVRAAEEQARVAHAEAFALLNEVQTELQEREEALEVNEGTLRQVRETLEAKAQQAATRAESALLSVKSKTAENADLVNELTKSQDELRREQRGREVATETHQRETAQHLEQRQGWEAESQAQREAAVKSRGELTAKHDELEQTRAEALRTEAAWQRRHEEAHAEIESTRAKTILLETQWEARHQAAVNAHAVLQTRVEEETEAVGSTREKAAISEAQWEARHQAAAIAQAVLQARVEEVMEAVRESQAEVETKHRELHDKRVEIKQIRDESKAAHLNLQASVDKEKEALRLVQEDVAAKRETISVMQAQHFETTNAHALAQSKGRRTAVRMLLTRTKRQQIGSSFRTWQMSVAGIKARDADLHKTNVMVRRWQRRSLEAAVNRWTSMVGARVFCRRVLSKRVHLLTIRIQSQALVTWCAFIHRKRDAENTTARMDAVGRKVARRMVLLTVASSFDRWAEHVAEKKEQRHKVGSIVRRWQRLGLCSVLEKWDTMTHNRIFCRRIMNKILQRYLLGAESRAFISWRAFVDNGRLEDTEATRQEVIVRKVANRMIKLTVARTFDRWFVHVAEAKAQRHTVATVLRRWQRGL